MKRIVICMDGTWQTLSQDQLTNIGIISRSVAHTVQEPDPAGGTRDVQQVVIYTHGVGSNIGAVARRRLLGNLSAAFNRLAGGVFGEGLEDGVVDTYLRLAFNYEAGDEIFIFGFSRGAFAARRLAGFINTAGIVSRRHVEKAWMGYSIYHEEPGSDASEDEKREHAERAAQFRRLYGKGERNPDGTRRQTEDVPKITFLGVFDTVVQRGLTDILASATPWGRRRYRFNNVSMCPNVEAARHAVAIDENRVNFPPTLWRDLDELNNCARQRPGADPHRYYFEQRWFVGAHSDIGGGRGSALSAPALKWVTDGAAEQGLRFYGTYGEDESPLSEMLREAGICYDARITRPSFWKSLQPINFRGRPRKVWTERTPPTLEDIDRLFDRTVVQRVTADHVRPRYKPKPLRAFRKAFREWVENRPSA